MASRKIGVIKFDELDKVLYNQEDDGVIRIDELREELSKRKTSDFIKLDDLEEPLSRVGKNGVVELMHLNSEVGRLTGTRMALQFAVGSTRKKPARHIPRLDKKMQQRDARPQSIPFYQFLNQRRKERHELGVQLLFRGVKMTLPYQDGLDLDTNVWNNVKNRWLEQGIWNKKWDVTGPTGRWKHEEPPTPQPEPQPKRDYPPGLFGQRPTPLIPPPKPITEEQLAAHERETAASRPYHQFHYQFVRECFRVEDEKFCEFESFGIDEVAYERVKSSWIEQKIWNPRWGEVPGLTWMHEQDDKEEKYDEVEDDQESRSSGTGLFGRHPEVEPTQSTIFKVKPTPFAAARGERRSSNTGLFGRHPEVQPNPFATHENELNERNN